MEVGRGGGTGGGGWRSDTHKRFQVVGASCTCYGGGQLHVLWWRSVARAVVALTRTARFCPWVQLTQTIASNVN